MLDFIEPQYMGIIWIIAIAYTAAVITPGPDFACIMRNTLTCSKRSGLLSVLGVTLGMCFHLSYSIPGAVWLNSQPTLMLVAKIGGGLYLCYLGLRSIRAKAKTTETDPNLFLSTEKNYFMTPFQAFRSGFFTNALNPMVMVFFVGLFTTQIDRTMPISILAFLGVEVSLIALTWFMLVVFFFSQPAMHDIFTRLGHWLERVTGGILILLGIRVAMQIIP